MGNFVTKASRVVVTTVALAFGVGASSALVASGVAHAEPAPGPEARAEIDAHKRRAKDHAKKKEDLLATAEWRAAAELGDAEAQFALARRLERGLGVMDYPDLRAKAREEAAVLDAAALAQGYAPAVERVKKQAERGSGAAQGDLAKALEARGDWEAAVDYYRASFAQNQLDAPALTHFGDILCEGRIEAEPGETQTVYAKAVELGDAAGEIAFAKALFNGCGGVKIDPAFGKRVLEKGVVANHTEVLLELGRRYEQGDGLPREPLKALALYARSNAREAILARAQLLTSSAVKKDPKLAASILAGPARDGWFPAVDELLELANAGEPEAQYQIAGMYLAGKGIEQDAIEALRWFESAAAHDDGRALFALGQMYLRGEGVLQDDAKARAYFTRSAATGNADARRALGR